MQPKVRTAAVNHSALETEGRGPGSSFSDTGSILPSPLPTETQTSCNYSRCSFMFHGSGDEIEQGIRYPSTLRSEDAGKLC